MLEPIVGRARENHEVRPELEDTFEALHCRLVDEGPAVSRKGDRPVDYIVYGLCFEAESGFLRLKLAQLDVAAQTMHVLEGEV